MKALVTGGAGFIASHLEDLLIEDGWDIVSIDFSDDTGNIDHLTDNESFEFQKMDINNIDELIEISKGCDFVFHLAANSDIRAGSENSEVDFKNTFMTTKNVLDAIVKNEIRNLFFASTSAIYGDKPGIDLKEDEGNLKPISHYGAYKLASEAVISSYTHMYGLNSLIFRFPNVVGSRLTHGVIFDFINKLKRNPEELEILGDGLQKKQYVHVTDLAEGIMSFSQNIGDGMDVYNISTNSFINVNRIADIVCEGMGLKDVQYKYTGGSIGWKGDVSTFSYDISKAEANGWKFKFDSEQAVRETVREVLTE